MSDSNTSREVKKTKRQQYKEDDGDYCRDKNSSRNHNSSSSNASSKYRNNITQKSGTWIDDSHTDTISPGFDHTGVFAGPQKSRSSSSSTRGDGNSKTWNAAVTIKNSISGWTKDCWLVDHHPNNHTICDKVNACYRFQSTYVNIHSSI